MTSANLYAGEVKLACYRILRDFHDKCRRENLPNDYDHTSPLYRIEFLEALAGRAIQFHQGQISVSLDDYILIHRGFE